MHLTRTKGKHPGGPSAYDDPPGAIGAGAVEAHANPARTGTDNTFRACVIVMHNRLFQYIAVDGCAVAATLMGLATLLGQDWVGGLAGPSP